MRTRSKVITSGLLIAVSALAITSVEASTTNPNNKKQAQLEQKVRALEKRLEKLTSQIKALDSRVRPAVYLEEALKPWEAVNFNFLTTSLGACPKWTRYYGEYGKTSTGDTIVICNITALVRQYQ